MKLRLLPLDTDGASMVVEGQLRIGRFFEVFRLDILTEFFSLF